MIFSLAIRQCRPFIWGYVLSAASGVIAGFLALADSLLIKWLVDRALPARDLTEENALCKGVQESPSSTNVSGIASDSMTRHGAKELATAAYTET